MKISHDTKLDFDDVLLVPQRTKTASRKDVHLTRYFKFYHSPRSWRGIPVMAANMDTTGTMEMSSALDKFGMVTCLHKHYSWEDEFNFLNKGVLFHQGVWSSIGMSQRDFDKIQFFRDHLRVMPNICVDIANGYTEDFVSFCATVRQIAPDAIIMAGNVVTPEMVQELILHGGVDIVKIGIGPGSACTTRLKTGVGYPQLSAIDECAHAAHGLTSGSERLGLICADGGCRYPADVAKAFAADADFVMIGGMLAGTDECEGEWEYEPNIDLIEEIKLVTPDSEERARLISTTVRKKSLTFYGMSSKRAQDKHSGGMKSYRSSEGRVLNIPYKGTAKEVINDMLGGIRSACTYTGASYLSDFSKTAQFIKVNRVHHDKSV